MSLKMDAAANMWWGLGMCTGAAGGYAIMRMGNTVGTSLAALGLAILGLGVGIWGYTQAKKEVDA